MSKYFLLLFFFLFLSFPVFAVSDGVVINASDLPFSGSFDLSLGLVSGEFAFLSQDFFDSRVVLDFPGEVFFNGTDSLVVPVNFTVDFIPNGPVNFSSGLVVTNSFNNNSFDYLLNFSVVGDGFFFDNSSFDVRLLSDEYFVDVPDYLLPSGGVLDYLVEGSPGGSLNVTCGGPWLVCPNETLFFGGDGLLSFSLSYFVPEGVVLGPYEFPVTFESGGRSFNSSVFFNVTSLGFDIKPYVWDLDRCVNPVTGDIKYDCMVEYDEWNSDRLTAFYERVKLLSEGGVVGNSTVINSTVATEYLVVGNITEQASSLLSTLQSDFAVASDGFSACSDQLITVGDQLRVCQDDLSDCKQGFVEDGFELCESSLLSTELALTTCKDNIRKRNLNYWLITFGLLFLVVGVYYFVFVYKRFIWRF